MRYITLILLFVCSWAACDQTNTQQSDEPPIARVFEEKLYPSDLEGLVRKNTNSTDSVLLINDYIQSWVKDKLFAHAAQNNTLNDTEINRLVEDYRSSLLLNLYKKNLLKEDLDTTITAQQMQQYYNENKERYELQDNIARVHFIKVERNVERVGDLKRWWTLRKETYLDNLRSYAKKYAIDASMNDSLWISFADLEAKMPEDALKNSYFKSGERDIYLKDRKHRYFMRLLEVRKKGSLAPLSYVQDDITKFILKNKKKQLIDDKQEEILQQALKNNNVEIYAEE